MNLLELAHQVRADELHGTDLRAITLWQPWASFMFWPLGYPLKRIETRSWEASHRGVLVVHSAKREPRWVREAFCGEDAPIRMTQDLFDSLPRGYILGLVDLWDVVPTTSPALRGISPSERFLGDYTPGRFAWCTRNAQALLEPLPFRGGQRLWKLDGTLLYRRAWRAVEA